MKLINDYILEKLKLDSHIQVKNIPYHINDKCLLLSYHVFGNSPFIEIAPIQIDKIEKQENSSKYDLHAVILNITGVIDSRFGFTIKDISSLDNYITKVLNPTSSAEVVYNIIIPNDQCVELLKEIKDNKFYYNFFPYRTYFDNYNINNKLLQVYGRISKLSGKGLHDKFLLKDDPGKFTRLKRIYK